jgi:hypothetical protein
MSHYSRGAIAAPRQLAADRAIRPPPRDAALLPGDRLGAALAQEADRAILIRRRSSRSRPGPPMTLGKSWLEGNNFQMRSAYSCRAAERRF